MNGEETSVVEQPKAYDLKELAKELKSHGLDVAEEGAEAVVKSFFSWVKKSAPLSKTPYDDMAMVIVPQIEKQILALVDKIDGQEG